MSSGSHPNDAAMIAQDRAGCKSLADAIDKRLQAVAPCWPRHFAYETRLYVNGLNPSITHRFLFSARQRAALSHSCGLLLSASNLFLAHGLQAALLIVKPFAVHLILTSAHQAPQGRPAQACGAVGACRAFPEKWGKARRAGAWWRSLDLSCCVNQPLS